MAARPDAPADIQNDMGTLLKWFGVPDLNTWHNLDFEEKRAYHERFAESFERYLFKGEAPSIELQPVFNRFRTWLLSVYRSMRDFLAGHPEAGKLSDEVRSVFGRMLATSDAIDAAQQARSMMPLFETETQAGMTQEEFAAYQAQGQDATQEAARELDAKGLRDMQWLANAKSKILKRMQAESKEARAQMQIEARREVMSQPVYQAWQFLTGKAEEGSPDVGKLSVSGMQEVGLPVEIINHPMGNQTVFG